MSTPRWASWQDLLLRRPALLLAFGFQMDEELADALNLAMKPLFSLVGQAMRLCDGEIRVGQAVHHNVMPARSRPDVDFVTAAQSVHAFDDCEDFVT